MSTKPVLYLVAGPIASGKSYPFQSLILIVMPLRMLLGVVMRKQMLR